MKCEIIERDLQRIQRRGFDMLVCFGTENLQVFDGAVGVSQRVLFLLHKCADFWCVQGVSVFFFYN